jgi:predicted aminopeptidase
MLFLEKSGAINHYATSAINFSNNSMNSTLQIYEKGFIFPNVFSVPEVGFEPIIPFGAGV